MSAKRYEPFNDISKGFDLVNSIINTLNEEKEPQETFDFRPKVNSRETEEAYSLEVELPGVQKENVEINLDGKVLSISGERSIKEGIKEEEYQKVESHYGLFSRSFTLPEKVDSENIGAKFENGVLEISIPKLTVEKASKKIEIQ